LYDLLTRTSFDVLEEAALELKPGYRVPLGDSDFDEGVGPGADRAIAARLKEQMRADSLRPLQGTLDEKDELAMKDAFQPGTPPKTGTVVDEQPDFDEETVEAAREHLQKSVSDATGSLALSDHKYLGSRAACGFAGVPAFKTLLLLLVRGKLRRSGRHGSQLPWLGGR
jgi:hypothetical protein